MGFRFRALGLEIVAPFACPGFWPVTSTTTGREIVLVLGSVPPSLANPVRTRPLLQIGQDGAVLFRVPGVARYLITGRESVTIEPESDTPLDRAVEFFKGTPLAVLCRRWDLVPLSAVALAVDGRALLLGGAAGCGKSTLALAFAAHGLRIMADGLCAVEPRPGKAPLVWPAFPEVKVWKPGLAALALPPPAGGPNPGGRYTLPVEDWFDPEPRPALATAALHPANGGTAERLSRRRGASAFEAVMNMMSLTEVMRGLGTNPLHAAAALATTVPVHEAFYPPGLDRVAALPRWLFDGLGLPLAEPDRTVEVAPCA